MPDAMLCVVDEIEKYRFISSWLIWSCKMWSIGLPFGNIDLRTILAINVILLQVFFHFTEPFQFFYHFAPN